MSTVLPSKARLVYATSAAMLTLLWFLLLSFSLHTILHAAPFEEQEAVDEIGTITGRVTASDGNSLGTLGVAATRDGDFYSAATTLDATGHYILSGLPPGTYQVKFNPDEEGPYLWEFYNKKLTDAVDLVPVSANATTSGIDAVLQLGGMIQGRVTSELTGEPLAGIGIRAQMWSGDDPFVERDAYADATGLYTITALRTGSYEVSFNFVSEGFREDYGQEYYDNKSSESDADPVSVTVEVKTTGINAALAYVVSITGSVTTADGTPLAGVTVTTYNAAGDPSSSDFTKQTGHYTLTHLQPGPYRIHFGGDTVRPEFYADRGTFEEADVITVAAGVVVPNVNAVLLPQQPTDVRLASASTRPNVLLAAYAPRFIPMYSLDGGQTWQEFATLPPFDFSDTPHLAVVPKADPAQPVRFLLARNDNILSSVPSIYRTGDAGVSWDNFRPLADPHCNQDAYEAIAGLATSPADPQRVYAITSCDIFSGHESPLYYHYRNLYTSADGGVTWQKVTNPTEDDIADLSYALLPSPAQAGRVYVQFSISAFSANGPGSVWQRSDNAGETWTTETFTLTTLLLDWVNANQLYGVEDVGGLDVFSENLFRYTGKRSTDGGNSWSDWNQQPCRTTFRQLVTLPTADTLLLLCDQGLYRSRNGGDIWEKVATETGGVLAVHAGDRELVLWVRGHEVWGSRDQGTTWSRLSTLPAANVLLPFIHRP